MVTINTRTTTPTRLTKARLRRHQSNSLLVAEVKVAGPQPLRSSPSPPPSSRLVSGEGGLEDAPGERNSRRAPAISIAMALCCCSSGLLSCGRSATSMTRLEVRFISLDLGVSAAASANDDDFNEEEEHSVVAAKLEQCTR